MIHATRAILFVLMFTIAGCDDKPKNPSTLLEVIDVQGECWKDHVGQRDNYSGVIVRWQNKETGDISAYGFVNGGFSADRIVEEAKHPTKYYPPFMIEFTQIGIDTSQPNWVLHGVSDRNEDSDGVSHGYDTTCQLQVTNRGNELPDPIEDKPNKTQPRSR